MFFIIRVSTIVTGWWPKVLNNDIKIINNLSDRQSRKFIGPTFNLNLILRLHLYKVYGFVTIIFTISVSIKTRIPKRHLDYIHRSEKMFNQDGGDPYYKVGEWHIRRNFVISISFTHFVLSNPSNLHLKWSSAYLMEVIPETRRPQ
jgi:hypothetical protein